MAFGAIDWFVTRLTPRNVFKKRFWRRWKFLVARPYEIGRHYCRQLADSAPSIGFVSDYGGKRREEIADLTLSRGASQADPSQPAECGRAHHRIALGAGADFRQRQVEVFCLHGFGGLELSANRRSIRELSSQCGRCDAAPHAAEIAGTFKDAEPFVVRAESAAVDLGSHSQCLTFNLNMLTTLSGEPSPSCASCLSRAGPRRHSCRRPRRRCTRPLSGRKHPYWKGSITCHGYLKPVPYWASPRRSS